jgi:hypothetical protein
MGESQHHLNGFLKKSLHLDYKNGFSSILLGEHNVHLPKIFRNGKDLGQGKLLIFIEHNYEKKGKVGFYSLWCL